MNDPLSHLESAVLSRFIPWAHLDWDVGTGSADTDTEPSAAGAADSRPRRHWSILQMNMTRPGYAESRLTDEMKHAHWVRQTLVVLANKAIQACVLPDVDMRVCDYACFRMLRYIQEHSSISITSYRKYERVRSAARVLALESANSLAFSNPYDHASAHDGLPGTHAFAVRDIMRLKPFLVCQLEHAVFAFTMFAHQWLNPFDAAVVRGALDLQEFPVTAQATFLEAQHRIAQARGLRGDAAIVAPNGDGKCSFAARFYAENPAPRFRSMWARRLDETTGTMMVDLNYVVFRGNLGDLARALHSVMDPRPSKELIQSALTQLTERVLTMPAHEPIAEAQLHAGVAPAMRMRRLNVLVQRFGREHEVHIAAVALDQLTSDTLLTRAIQSVAYRGLRPATFLMGTMADRTNGELARTEITAAQCAAGPAAFAVASADFMTNYQRRATFGPRVRSHTETYRSLGTHVAGAAADEDSATEDEEAMDAAFQEALQQQLNPERMQSHVRITEDLDTWAVRTHFERTGIPLCRDADDTPCWLYTARDGTRLRRPLPTTAAQHAETVRQVRSSARERHHYNAMLQGLPDAERTARMLTAPAVPEPAPIASYVAPSQQTQDRPAQQRARSALLPSERLRHVLEGSDRRGTQRARESSADDSSADDASRPAKRARFMQARAQAHAAASALPSPSPPSVRLMSPAASELLLSQNSQDPFSLDEALLLGPMMEGF
jgi:hypothetical protein